MPELHQQRLIALALGTGDTGPAVALLGPLLGAAVTLRAVRHPHQPPGSPLLLHRAVDIQPRSRLQVTDGPGGAGDQLATPALSVQTISQQKTVLVLANKSKKQGPLWMEYCSFKGELPSWGETESGDRIRSREVNGMSWLTPRAVVTTSPARRKRTVSYRARMRSSAHQAPVASQDSSSPQLVSHTWTFRLPEPWRLFSRDRPNCLLRDAGRDAVCFQPSLSPVSVA